MSLSQQSTTVRYAVAVLATIVAIGLRLALDPVVGDRFPFVTVVFAVLMVAWFGGFGPASVTAVLGAVLTARFIIPPRDSFFVSGFDNQAGLALYLMVALGIASLTGLMQRARDRAGAQREELRTTLASIGDAVIATDPDGCVMTLNCAAESLTGWPAAEARGRPLADVFRILNEETRGPVPDSVARVLATGTVVGLGNHTILIRRDGAELPIDDTAAPIRDADGRLRGVVLVFRDVTEARRADAARRHLAAIVEGSDDAIIGKALDGTITSWNSGAERLYGYPAAEVIGKPFSVLVPPEHAEEMEEAARRLRAGARVDHFETVRQRKDGRRIDVSVSYSPLRDSEGHLTGTAVIARDVTDRTRAERRRNARLAVTQVLSQTDGLETAAPRILRAVCEGLDWTVGAVWMVDGGDNLIRCVAAWGDSAAGADRFLDVTRQFTFSPGVGLPGHVWADRKPHWWSNVAVDERFPRRHAASADGLHGGFAAPIAVGDNVLGVIEFFCREVRELDPDLLEMMATLGGQIGQFVERRRALAALTASEARFAAVIHNAPAIVFLKDPDGVYQIVNPRFAEGAGLTVEQIIGRTDHELFDPDVADGFRKDDVDVLASGRARTFEESFAYRGRTYTFLTAKFPLPDASGRPLGVCGIATDITARKEAEAELRTSEERLRLALEAGRMGVWDWDVRTDAIEWSDNLEPIHGLAPGTFAGTIQAWQQLIHAADRGTAKAAIARALADGTNYDLEFRNVWPDGSIHWMSGKGQAFVESGEPVRLIGVVTDVTTRKRDQITTRFLADASAVLGALTDEASTLQKLAALAVPNFADWCTVDLAGPDGSIHRVGVAHVDPTKVRLAREVHRRWPPAPAAAAGAPAIIRSGRSELVPEITDDMLADSIPDPEYLGIVRELGVRSFMGVPISVRGKVLGAITFVTAESGRRYDATDLGAAEELARRAAVAVENAHLYQAIREQDRRKDEFLATLAHELRNPLAPVRNALHLFRTPGVNPTTLDRARDMMERQVLHLVRLVDDLLDVSRVMRGKIELRKELVDLGSAVGRAVETAEPLLTERGHQLSIHLPPGPVYLEADPVRLAQVFANLLTNAAKYTEPGGRIRVAAEVTGRRGEPAPHVVVRVCDTGVGIAPDMLPRVFDLFVQVDNAAARSQGGLGIGLTLVKSLVELHGGTVAVQSDGAGTGSEFVVRLPVVPIAGQTPGGDPRRSRPVCPSRRVLVVDDHADAADSLAMLLRMEGHEVRVARNGQAAVREVRADRPEVILLDLGMPGMDGFEVARQLRQSPGLADIYLVALTGWGQEEDRRRTREAGFDDHFVKPVDPDDLRALLARGRPARTASAATE